MLKLNMKQKIIKIKTTVYRLPTKCNLIITCYMKLMHLYVHMYHICLTIVYFIQKRNPT